MMSTENQNGRPRPRVALLGAGTMGAGIARRLRETGFTVDVWNRSAGPAADLARDGATAHATATQAVATAGVVVTMLPHEVALDEVMLGGGTLDALHPGAIWLQMGTIGIEATERFASAVAGRRPDVAFVDAPVLGSRGPARTGGLTVLASGPEPARTTLEPVFDAISQKAFWLGPAGAGSRMKLVANTLLAFETEAVAEVRAIAAGLGIPEEELVAVVGESPLASGFEMTKLAKMESGDDSADFSLRWALKDLDLALAGAGRSAAPIAGAIAERWRELVELGYGARDVSVARMGLESAPVGSRPVPIEVPARSTAARAVEEVKA